MQSFKMYLGKGIENFTNLPVAPGRMWVTDNDNADVIEFGGEAENPSEDHHIQELREAMDKSSSVTPIAAGAIRGRIGNLTSAAALRVTMMSLLAKTERKRTTYGQAICRMCELAMAWLDQAGLFPSSAEERKFTINWPGILPDSQMEQLREAQAKMSLGIPQIVVLKELGYDVSLETAETGNCIGSIAAAVGRSGCRSTARSAAGAASPGTTTDAGAESQAACRISATSPRAAVKNSRGRAAGLSPANRSRAASTVHNFDCLNSRSVSSRLCFFFIISPNIFAFASESIADGCVCTCG
jgi:hypothetical protein